jgi:hypothetical protein
LIHASPKRACLMTSPSKWALSWNHSSNQPLEFQKSD